MTTKRRKVPLPLEGARRAGYVVRKELRWVVMKIPQNAPYSQDPKGPVELVAHYPVTPEGRAKAFARVQGLADHFVVWFDKTVVAYWEKVRDRKNRR